MAKSTAWLLALLPIPALILLHLYVAPYTKVEESFNIQAVHDILIYGVPSKQPYEEFKANYDHFTFPGAVPRTFVGALVVAGIARPFIWLNERVDRQFLARAILGLFNAFALAAYAMGVKRAFGATAAVWYSIFQAGQFHIIYYASRTLPNMFAFGLCTLALRYLLPQPSNSAMKRSKQRRLSLYLLTLAGVIFRSEVAILLATHTVYFYLQGQLSIRKEILPAGVSGLVIGLALTVSIDSYFWQKFPLWPEFSAFYYNIIDNEASAWGISSWHYYFTSALPRLLLNPVSIALCIPVSLLTPATRFASLNLLIPNLAFIGLYSLVPHKEARFILYSIPSLSTSAALGASYIWNRRTRTLAYRLLSLFLIVSTVGTAIFANLILLPLSSLNYPGATALNRLHVLAHGSKRIIAVHMDDLSCQTGVTRFLEMPPPKSLMVQLPGSANGAHPTLRSGTSLWLYDKTESTDLLLDPAFWHRFDYVLAEKPELAIGSWEVVETVKGFAGWRVTGPGETQKAAKQSTNQVLVHHFAGQTAASWWGKLECVARKYLTKGWWIEARMEGKIHILKKGSGVRERVASA